MGHPTLDQWQYRISDEYAPDAIKVGQSFLEVGPGMNAIPLSDRNGISVGFLLGFPIDLHAERFLESENTHKLQCSLSGDIELFVEEVMEALSGSFLFILNLERISRIYVNCSAQVPCVYDPNLKVAASTAHAIFNEDTYWERFDKKLYTKLDIAREGWFPAGLTAHKGVERVLPNHYLDLQSWSTKRHWPCVEIGPSENPATNVDEFARLMQIQMRAVLQGSRSVSQALTAGHETRALLSCFKDSVKEISFATVVDSDRRECDAIIAQKMSMEHDLKHIKLERIEASQAQKDLFIRRGGHCVGDTNSLYHPSVWPLANNYVLIGGLGGEIGRAFLWRTSDKPETKLTAGRLASRLGLPQDEKIVVRLDRWMSELPPCSTYSILDLAYIEHRMGPWYAAQFCCDPTLVRISPMLNRRTVEMFLSLPSEWKRENRFLDLVIERFWPKLTKYPYNSLGFWNDSLLKLQRVMRNPHVVLKKMRKVIGG